MKTSNFPILAILSLAPICLTAQVTNNLQLPTSINTDGSAPNASAMLDVQSNTKGMLVPRMTTAQRTAIATPATGLLVFDTTTGGFWFYNGTAWQNLSTPKALADADNDTKIQVEESADEDVIRFDVAGTERLLIRKNNATGNRTLLELPNNGDNVFLGISAGLANTTGTQNTLLGTNAGVVATTSSYNTIVGCFSGINTTTGTSNTFLGQGAGNFNVSGSFNTYIGRQAGLVSTGSGNVFLGNDAGFNEMGSNRLYIDNSATNTPLIWGDFTNNLLAVNGKLGVGTSNLDEKLVVDGAVKIGAASSECPAAGTIRWNAATGDFEGFNGNIWKSLTHQGNTWGNFVHSSTENAQLTASNAASGDQFGNSVSLDGKFAVVGAPGPTFSPNNTNGKAYVYQYLNGSWVQLAILTASDGAVADMFGASVSISGDLVIVGAPSHDTNGNNNQGKAYIFVRPGGGWAGTLTETAKLTASDGAANNKFGTSVSVSGDFAMVGAPGHFSAGKGGKAYIFVKPGGGWSGNLTENAQLTASNGFSYSVFGFTVAVSGDQAIIGDYEWNSGSGRAYIFVKPGGGWSGNLSENAQLTNSDGGFSFQFGGSVGLSGDQAIVGSFNAGSNGYIYVKPGGGWNGVLSESARLHAPVSANPNAVSISGNQAVVGCLSAEKAFIFVKPGSGWSGSLTETATLTASGGTASDHFGTSVSISGDQVIVGADLHNLINGSDQGKVYFFAK
ncbi:MAG: hypothetical protein H6577_00750 [Lewinellaceae bacterium]|nr:hypothetical protein [Saprospiraceae bacterium]MCB9336636.1 hypothetical protein [Lewinellaceae bacterium]